MKHKLKLHIAELEKKNYHLFVELKIGKVNCRLLLDTGASKTVFDNERILRFVNETEVNTNESKSVGLGVEEMETKVAILKHLKLGMLRVNKLEVAVLPIGHVNTTYSLLNIPKIDGVLGSDFLMKHKAVINYAKKVLVLQS
jgi:predicted aspartyl protease